MTAECHMSPCPKHSCHTPGEEGPFCYEDECHATEEELEVWHKIHTERMNKALKTVRTAKPFLFSGQTTRCTDHTNHITEKKQ